MVFAREHRVGVQGHLGSGMQERLGSRSWRSELLSIIVNKWHVLPRLLPTEWNEQEPGFVGEGTVETCLFFVQDRRNKPA